MNYICLDTNAWIYFANGTEPANFLATIKKEIDNGNVTLLLPSIVIDEWHRNKDEAIKSGVLKHFADVNNGLERITKLMGGNRNKNIINQQSFDDVFFSAIDKQRDRRVSTRILFEEISSKFKNARKRVEEAVAVNISLVESLFSLASTKILTIRADTYIKAGEFAVAKKAPFLKKNSFADALIMFSFLEYVETYHISEALFVTYNTDDFCEKKNGKKTLHPDLLPEFTRSNSQFYPIAGEAISFINNNINLMSLYDALEEAKNTIDNEEEAEVGEEYCSDCSVNGFYHPIDFHSQIDLDDERSDSSSRRRQMEILFAKDVSWRYEPLTRITVGNCTYCDTEHFMCASCGCVNSVDSGDYNIRKDCEKCGIPYYIDTSYGENRPHIGRKCNSYSIILRYKICKHCSKEFWNDGSESTLCDDCKSDINLLLIYYED